VGEGIAAYTQVEAAMAALLQAILRIDVVKAHAIFFAVLSARARNELIEVLLQAQFNGRLTKYWASCSEYLQKLAKFRNALAHWHPFVNVYLPSDWNLPASKLAHALGHPAYGQDYESLEIDDVAPFLQDCAYIRGEIAQLAEVIRTSPATLPERFQQPISGQNKARLQRRRKPKAHPRQPQSSPGSTHRKERKVSSKQRRQRAIREAKDF
jgi:hypothetical protein